MTAQAGNGNGDRMAPPVRNRQKGMSGRDDDVPVVYLVYVIAVIAGIAVAAIGTFLFLSR